MKGGKVGVLCTQLDAIAAAPKPLHGDFFAQPGDNNLAVLGVTSGMNGQQVPVQDARVSHGQSPHPQQVVRALGEQAALHGISSVHMGLRQDGRACRHAPDQRQPKRFQFGPRADVLR